MILAAGFGKRLKPLTDSMPKALVDVGGRPVIDRVIDQVKSIGIKDIIVNVHYLADEVAAHIKSRKDVNSKIIYEDPILETGGGILNAFNQIEDDMLLIMNADNVYGSNQFLKSLFESWDPLKMNFLVALKEVTGVKTYRGNGDYSLDARGRLSTLNPNYIYSGAYIVTRKFFEGRKVEKFRVPDVIAVDINKDNKNYGLPVDEEWFDIGEPEFLTIANEYVKSKDN